ncbi:spermidine synthase-like protein [gamma proteobacterium BDW918]|nr:spermidine synthase-like protein [gamma proteobacterium BDW918]
MPQNAPFFARRPLFLMPSEFEERTVSIQRRAASILLLEGLASSGLQMIAIRQTTPFVGSSILSTSIVISTFLAALAVGYFVGGRVKLHRFAGTLHFNLLVATVVFAIGLSYPFVDVFFSGLSLITSGASLLGNPLLHLFIYCLLVLVPLVFLLAQTVPLLLNISTDLSTSEAAGNATAISTLGNVVGCIFTSLVVMYLFGVGASILINCIYLVICIWLTSGKLPKQRATTLIGSAAILALAIGLNILIPRSIMSSDGIYSNIRVFDVEDGTKMMMNGSNASFLERGTGKGWPYIEQIKAAIKGSKIENPNVLVLGAGGFTLTASGMDGVNVVYVDVDKEAKAVAEREFLKAPITGQFVEEDARRYLLTNTQKWDFIVVDVYSNASTIPAHIATQEFFSLVSNRLTNEGKAILNIVAYPALEDAYSASMDFTIRSAFPFCITHLSAFGDELANILYFCRNRKGSNDVASLYKDDTSRVEVEGFLALQARKSK